MLGLEQKTKDKENDSDFDFAEGCGKSSIDDNIESSRLMTPMQVASIQTALTPTIIARNASEQVNPAEHRIWVKRQFFKSQRFLSSTVNLNPIG